jgi:glucose-6-phosphate 1-dehydrogenase
MAPAFAKIEPFDLVVSRKQAEAAGRFIDPIRAARPQSHQPPRPYGAGSWGPAAAITLIERDGRAWNEEVQ